jgi:glycosyltransferase involved in cell wall biosynthesis
MVHLVHSHGFTAGVLTVAAGAYTNIPHLMTAHDVFQEKQFEGAIGKFRRGLLVQLLRRIDVIHTVSQDATDNLLEYIHGLDKSQLCLIPHGIDADRFFFAVPLNTKSRYDSDRVLVGFFGRFMSQKGFRYLVDAVEMIVRESMSSKRPLVLTFSEGGYIREDYAYIQERGLGDYFRKMPHVDDMPAVIKSVDMVIMPSLWEACGLLGMEALVAGVPIIGSSCIGLREVLRDTPASMVPPADARALAEAIAGEMNMPRKDEFMKYACTARQRFSLDRPAAELNELYTRMLESRVRI